VARASLAWHQDTQDAQESRIGSAGLHFSCNYKKYAWANEPKKNHTVITCPIKSHGCLEGQNDGDGNGRAAVIKTPSGCGQKKTESHLTRGHLRLIRT